MKWQSTSDISPYNLLPFQEQFLRQVELAEMELDEGGNSQGFLLLGESGIGKTFVFDRLAQRYPSSLQGHQRITPLVRYSANTGPNFSAACQGLLVQLGASPVAASQIKPANLENALRKALAEHKTRIVVLEEFHNALTNEGRQFRSRFRDFLKNLWNFFPDGDSTAWASSAPGGSQRKLIVIVSGAKVLREVFQEHDEIRTRYNIVIEANRLSISSPEEFMAFRMLLAHFVERFDVRVDLKVDSDEFSMRCYLATGALVRALEKLFQRAGTLSRRKEFAGKPAMEIFAEALEQVDQTASQEIKPFSSPYEHIAKLFNVERIRQTNAAKSRK